MAQLVDKSLTDAKRLEVAQAMCELPPCCVDPLFGLPVINAINDCGGPVAENILNGPLAADLETAFRGKVSNIEIELNFARASCCRQSLHGRAHSISSMVAKHVSAEIKVGHCGSVLKNEVRTSSKRNHAGTATTMKPQHGP